MFKHLFATMNEMLDEVMSEYPSSTVSNRKVMMEKLRALKAMSDGCIEEWLLFEEKLGNVMRSVGLQSLNQPVDPLDPEFSARRSDEFIRGQGYYKLHMFQEAIHEFNELLHKQPDFTLARIFLALAYLHKGETQESYAHFQFLSQLTENLQIKAISFNAMGCIQVQQNNLDKASELFNMAYRIDPSSMEPLLDLGVCKEQQGSLRFCFSSDRLPKNRV